jgi:hypothetical protein
MFPLLTLPNELIDAIVSVLSDRGTLLAVAQTCSRLQPFAEAQLFKNIFIHDGPSVSRLARDLEQPAWRMRAVEHLEVTPTMHSWPRGIALMPELVRRLARLKSLNVESPLISSGVKPSWWVEGTMVEYMDLFAGNGTMECLTSCMFAVTFAGRTKYRPMLIIKSQHSHASLARYQQPVLQYQGGSARLSVTDS